MSELGIGCLRLVGDTDECPEAIVTACVLGTLHVKVSNLMTLSLVSNLLILFSCGLLAAVICRWLKVSVSIGYVVVGALIGQGGIGWVFDDDHELAHFAEVGVFLLF